MPARPILNLLKSSNLAQKFSKNFAAKRWAIIQGQIKGPKILDFGLGMGSLAKHMIENGFLVTGLDVDNTSLWNDIQPVIYNGTTIPFANQQFDCATVICVLHHCQNQQDKLKEIMRVSKRAVVIEDTYRNSFEHFAIAVRDSLENWEFYPHTYRSYAEWRDLCLANGWKVRHVKSWSSWDFGILYGHQTCFVIEK